MEVRSTDGASIFDWIDRIELRLEVKFLLSLVECIFVVPFYAVDMIKPDATIILRNAKIDMFKVDMMKPDATIILRNAKIDMFKGSMRLAVDKWGRVEVTEPASFIVKEDNNLSLVEYELVNVVEEWLVQM
ncbi:hypothetical protein TEA_004030 [Camellia sinensis var. sinensis]|uniref:Single-stranded DNA binding protein Ssb-like OB fold domain-containing protein n=1 Tax=Camellia sinensis var. sinensis TaxID=542762 RepID=A0A4S4DTB6_CAMSN|nr:hypothetical protein TEA_004030 [Camellia sinensis var. sinensis]